MQSLAEKVLHCLPSFFLSLLPCSTHRTILLCELRLKEQVRSWIEREKDRDGEEKTDSLPIERCCRCNYLHCHHHNRSRRCRFDVIAVHCVYHQIAKQLAIVVAVVDGGGGGGGSYSVGDDDLKINQLVPLLTLLHGSCVVCKPLTHRSLPHITSSLSLARSHLMMWCPPHQSVYPYSHR